MLDANKILASVTVTFEVPETGDKCWTPDGVQCFYDAVIKQAHVRVTRSLIAAITKDDKTMQGHFQRRLDVINSVKVETNS